MLFETILCENGAAQNIKLHEQRIYESIGKKMDLSFLSPPDNGKYRCKVIYGDTVVSVEYAEYIKKQVKSLKVLHSDISYKIKSTDRTELDSLFSNRGEADDVLIIKNGLVTDTSIANTAFLKNNRWITPKTPLLKGTMRQKLINDGFLFEEDIEVAAIFEFDEIAIMNALRGFEPLGLISDVIKF